MNALVVGTREDVAGFALAGIAGVICATRDEAEQAIKRAADSLVFVSSQFCKAKPREGLVVVLPPRS
ncbi:MAG TPA: V-type ATP synthase subunit F [Thermoanaerobaculia bacterium]